MADSNISIIGATTSHDPSGAVPLRREIRDLQANYKEQWNLYLLGLDALQKTDENDLLSYYQIAGIHGMPYKAWDGVDGLSDLDNFGGYCTHSSVLFLTWHRPYLALYEQVLFNIIQDIAGQFAPALRDRYVAAAKSFRIPYWDWAARVGSTASAFPTSISSQQITVTGTDGKSKVIDNPLYTFQFHPLNPSPDDFDQRWSQFPETIRWPNNKGQSQNNRISQVMANENASLRTNVSLLLLSYTSFDAFSNNKWDTNSNPGTYGSLEDIHNEIHDKTGGQNARIGGGHMGALEVSAFDPVFWLHHCNVDRLWAIWQSMNSDFIQAQPSSDPSFTTAVGTLESADSPLKPFWDQSGTDFWTSARVIDSKTFGYAYPETQSWNFQSTSDFQASVRNSVIQLYGGNVVSEFFKTLAVKPALAASMPAAAAALPHEKAAHSAPNGTTAHSAPNGTTTHSAPNGIAAHSNGTVNTHPSLLAQHPTEIKSNDDHPLVHPPEISGREVVPETFSHIVADNKYTEWITNLRAVKHGLSQTFRVIVFLGDFNPDPETWPFEYNAVGRFTVLGRSPNSQCSKCESDRASDLVVTGTVPLTSALLQDIVAGRLASLNPADVEPYLQKNLHWRVTRFDGTEVPVEEVPGLKVSVCSTEVSIAQDSTPVFSGHYTVHPTITDGRPAGLGQGGHS